MSDRNKKNSPFAAILFGPALGFFAVTALWHNEGRFDYYKAARDTTPVEALAPEDRGTTVSISGWMDQDLTLDGDYVSSFRGYLTVRRSAQIYCWKKNKDSDGDVTWDLRWQSSVESNSRNNDVHQKLASRTIAPDEYLVGDWYVDGDDLAFIDSRDKISPNELTLSVDGEELELTPDETHFYLRKGASRDLGDERVGYSGIPVPRTATYFGILQGDRGVAHVAEVKTGWVKQIIGDTGILHHLAGGDRDVALGAMKASLSRLKWLVRVLGTVGTIFGYLIFFSAFFGILLYVPVLNRVAEFGIMIGSLILGLLTSFVTIATSYLVHHPIIVLAILGAVVAIILYSRGQRRRAQAGAQQALAREFGHPPSARELAERQLVGMARVALADGQLDDKEKKFLQAWAGRRGLSEDDVARLLTSAEEATAEPGISSDKELSVLIQLALADQHVSPFELKKLFQAGKQLGYTPRKVRNMVTEASRVPPLPPMPA